MLTLPYMQPGTSIQLKLLYVRNSVNTSEVLRMVLRFYILEASCSTDYDAS